MLGSEGPAGIRYLVDPRVVPGTRWVTGANQPGRHVFDLVAGRDFTGDGIDRGRRGARRATRRRTAPGPLELARGIEMGHIFQLGRKYADALGLQVLDENGKLVTVTMGSYGIGVTRAVAGDRRGHPRRAGPVLAARRSRRPTCTSSPPARTPRSFEAAERAGRRSWTRPGSTVLYDDRPKVSPGVKFKDAELIGMPTIVTVGRGLAEGVVELRDRATGERRDVPVDDALDAVLAEVRGG